MTERRYTLCAGCGRRTRYAYCDRCAPPSTTAVGLLFTSNNRTWNGQEYTQHHAVRHDLVGGGHETENG